MNILVSACLLGTDCRYNGTGCLHAEVEKQGMMNMSLAKTPTPPYYAVIFTSTRTEGDNGYSQMAEEVLKLAEQQPGFLGAESVRNADRVGITVSVFDVH